MQRFTFTERYPLTNETTKYSAASGRSMKRNNTIFIPSPYPSPQGEGTSGNPTASGWGIKNIINIIYQGGRHV